MERYSNTILNKQGKPVAGAVVVVTTYPGNEPATIYAADGGPAVPSVTSDETGRFGFYAADGHYNLSITSKDIEPVTITDVVLNDPDNDAASAPFQPLTPGAPPSTVGAQLSHFPDVLDLGAVNDGVVDASNALEAFWQIVRASRVNYDATSLDWVPTKFIIPPGKYRVTRSLNWTNLRAWNVHIEAEGALFVAEVNGKSVIDMCDCRGVHLSGLAIQTAAGFTPKSAIMIGPSATSTCGNNRFSNVKTAGNFSIAACHNIGSETTLYDFCYWQNKVGTGYAYAGDCSHTLGATSDYVTLRSPGVPVSFTNNAFQGNRFANYAASGNSVYIEGTSGWAFDKMCYFLCFDNATVTVRQIGVIRTAALKIAGLFETDQGAGLKHVVRFVVDDGSFSACDGFELDAAVPHAKTSIIKLETPAGANLTSGSFSIRSAQIKVDATYSSYTPKLFVGAFLSYAGELRVRPSVTIDLSALVNMHGVIYTADATLITRAAAGAKHAYIISDDMELSGQGMQVAGSDTGAIGFHPGAVPRIRSVGSAANYDLWLSGKGTGSVRFGTLTASADAAVTGYITIKDEGGTTRKLAVIT